ncbi:MAG: NAD(P)-dependent oxidoreductase [Rhodospirillales bacterium]|nr:NAD(P)-dependent oxidoreductase [Rhodospirillales bacterium]
MRRVLLTGASGFIGRACVAPLRARGYEVHGVSRRAGPPVDGVVMHRGDLLDLPALPGLLARIGATHLLHAAWDVTPGYWISPANAAWREAGRALLAGFIAAGGRRAVGVGSCAEYVWDRPVLAEANAGPAPATAYGAAKLALGQDFGAAGHLGAWARLFFPYGPHEARGRLLPEVIQGLLHGTPVALTAGTQIRDVMAVGDVGAALAALLDSALGGAVNIGAGAGIALADLAREAARQLGGAGLLRFAALPMRDGEPPALVADGRRLRAELGFAPRIGLAEGVADAIAYWRAAPPDAAAGSVPD